MSRAAYLARLERERLVRAEQQGRARVRVRYVGPAPLGAPDAGLRYTAYTPSPTPSVQPPASPAPYVGIAPATSVASQPLTPIAAPAPSPAAMPVAAGLYRIQAGAFADPANAQKVIAQLGGAVNASIEPVQRADGMTLYRVMVQGTADEGEAWALRDRVASYGLPEARVVRPGA